MTAPFHFYTAFHLVRLLGRRAKNAVELMEGLREVPSSSIYYHTHRFLQEHQYLSPEPPNDFAHWLTDILRLEELGEALASIDVVSFRNMEELRTQFVATLERYLSTHTRIVDCPEGHEFHFMSCVLMVMPTQHVVQDMNEFLHVLEKISIRSLCFHVFEARMRLERDENDFSAWFRHMGEAELADKLSRRDPYNITLEGLRREIMALVSKYAGN